MKLYYFSDRILTIDFNIILDGHRIFYVNFEITITPKDSEIIIMYVNKNIIQMAIFSAKLKKSI